MNGASSRCRSRSESTLTSELRGVSRPWRRSLVWLACLGPFFYASYGLANYLAAQRSVVPSIVFDWERQMPFWPWTIYPYWTINAFYALSLLIAPTRRVLDRHALRLLTAQVLAVTCFMLWPLRFTFGQPTVAGAPAALFAALRSFDAPFNQAPSLHIALAVILWDFYRRWCRRPWSRWLLHVWTLLICVSVLSTYQHHFIDIPTGALLGVLCVWLWPLERRTPLLLAMRPARELRRWLIAAGYALGGLVCAVGAISGYRAGVSWLLWLAWPAVSLGLVAAIYAVLGVRGFRIDAQGRMHWSTRWLLAPYVLAARVNSYVWTARMPTAQQVLPHLWLGRLPARRAWCRDGRPALVSFCGEIQLPAGARAACVPILDMTIPTPPLLLRASRAIERMRSDELATYVCCALGMSRSAAALSCWLVLHGHAADVERAVQMVRRARPQIVLGAAWLATIRAAVTIGNRGRHSI